MKNKTWIWICALVVVVLAVLLIWKPFDRPAAPEEPAQPAAETAAQPAVEQPAGQEASAPAEEAQPETSAVEEGGEEAEESPLEPAIVEDGGSLEIIVPEDQGTGGF